jgi:hypothetical protein
MKLLKTLFLALLILVVVFIAGKNVIVKAAVESGVQFVTGLPLKMSKLDIGIAKTLIDIEGLKISNPKGFEDPIMGDIPRIYVDYNLTDILKGTIHLESIQLHLNEFVVVKNRDGALNINSIKTVQTQKQEGAKPKPAPKKGKEPKIRIDSFQLKIGKVVYKDYSLAGKPVVQTFNLNLNEQFKNIDDIDALTRIILVKVLTGTTIGRLTNFDVSGLSSSVSGALSSSTALASEFMQDATTGLGQTGEQAKAFAQKTQAQLGGATKGVEEAAAQVQKTADQAAASLKSLTGGLKKLGSSLQKQES